VEDTLRPRPPSACAALLTAVKRWGSWVTSLPGYFFPASSLLQVRVTLLFYVVCGRRRGTRPVGGQPHTGFEAL